MQSRIHSPLRPGRLHIALAAALLLGAGVAGAMPPDGKKPHGAFRAHAEQAFDRLDTNEDGAISRAEFQAGVEDRFERLDANGDGAIDASEIAESEAAKARAQKRAERFLARYGAEAGGTVSRADFEAKEMARFERLAGDDDTIAKDALGKRHGGPRPKRAD